MKTKIWLVVAVVLIAGALAWVSQRSDTSTQEVTVEETRNFGDDGDEGGTVNIDVDLVAQEIVGKWVSVDDNKFFREFNQSGVAVDLYGGKVTSQGNWKLFRLGDGIQLDISSQADGQEMLSFNIVKITPEELELVYLGRGGALRFTRVK